jgi:hypothetical protein
MAVPYGLIMRVTIGKKGAPERRRLARHGDDRAHGRIEDQARRRRQAPASVEQLRTRAAAVPVGTVAPPPAQRRDPSVARVLASTAEHVVKAR